MLETLIKSECIERLQFLSDNGLLKRYEVMHITVEIGSLKMFKFLVSLKIEYHLSHICNYGRDDIFNYLIEKGDSFTNEELTRSFLLAAIANELSTLKLLIHYGEANDINIKYNLDSVLVKVCGKRNNSKMIEQILDMGADINVSYGGPLKYAINSGDIININLLISRGAYIEVEPRLAIMYAGKYGNMDIIDSILNSNALSKNEENWKTLIKSSCRSGKIELFKAIIENENIMKMITLTDSDYNILFSDAVSENRLEIIKYLMETCDYNVNNFTHFRSMPFYNTINYEVMLYLLNQGIDLSSYYTILLTSACILNNFDYVDFLVSRGAEVHAALSIACKYSNLKIIRYLVENEATPNNYDINRIFHNKNFSLEMLEYLLDRTSNSNSNLLDLACGTRKGIKVLKFLVNRGFSIDTINKIYYNFQWKCLILWKCRRRCKTIKNLKFIRRFVRHYCKVIIDLRYYPGIGSRYKEGEIRFDNFTKSLV